MPWEFGSKQDLGHRPILRRALMRLIRQFFRKINFSDSRIAMGPTLGILGPLAVKFLYIPHSHSACSRIQNSEVTWLPPHCYPNTCVYKLLSRVPTKKDSLIHCWLWVKARISRMLESWKHNPPVSTGLIFSCLAESWAVFLLKRLLHISIIYQHPFRFDLATSLGKL